MARNFHKKQALGALNELNVAPLMDLAFSLLIIFMVSTPLLEQAIEINLPSQQPTNSRAPADVEFQVVNIDADGQIYWGKQPVTPAEFNQQLANLASNPDPNPISLRLDSNLRAQPIVDALDAITRNKLTKISISTKPE
mgnify:CR=1 FL=1